MEEITISKKDKLYRTALWSACELFCIASLVYALVKGEGTLQILMCFVTMVLVTAPFLLGKLLRFELNAVVFTFCVLYALGPILGYVYKLYYLTNWYDDILHASGGVAFAVLGVYLAKFVGGKSRPSVLLTALFALFFSMAIALVWEFIEYGVDKIFHGDMQRDTVISYLDSYLLGGKTGEVGRIEGIEEIIVNGKEIGLGGYIDIGLIDTMTDLLVETAGALVLVTVYALDKDRHPMIFKRKE